jgi:hypothetical protein
MSDFQNAKNRPSWLVDSLGPLGINSFPKGYRHLAYLQTRLGYTVKKDMPQSEGPELQALYRSGDVWLQGGSQPFGYGDETAPIVRPNEEIAIGT